MLYVITEKNFIGVNLDEVENKTKEKNIQYKRTEYGIFFNSEDWEEMNTIAEESAGNVAENNQTKNIS